MDTAGPRTIERFQVLALDGGGLKGIYAAAALAALEEDFGIRVADHFDLITGTSTGGLIALGLAFGMSANDILEFYLRHQTAIFPAGTNRVGRMVRARYSTAPLREALEERFGDRKFGDSTVPLLIPSYDLTSDNVYLFRTPHLAKLRRDWKERVVDVALATTAAPTFLPAHQLRGLRLIDGGIIANNPSMYGIIEALTAFEAPVHTVHLLNIGTTAETKGRSKSLDKGGLLRWAQPITDVVLNGQAQTAINHTALLLGQARTHRINVEVPKNWHRLDKVDASDLCGRAQASARHHSPNLNGLFAHIPAPYIPCHP